MANFFIGDRVKHKVFGEGDIMDITGLGIVPNSPSHLMKLMIEK